METSALPSVDSLPSPDFFTPLNRFMIAMFRLGLGPYFRHNGYIMILGHTGRKTGLKRQTPVNYAQTDGDLYCVAGYGQLSQWFRNLQANPEVEVWLGNQHWKGRAETVSDPDAGMGPWRQVMINSGPAARVWLQQDPATLPDALIRQGITEYPLARIRLEEELHGPGGPGDLIWVWGVVAAALLMIALLLPGRPRRERPR